AIAAGAVGVGAELLGARLALLRFLEEPLGGAADLAPLRLALRHQERDLEAARPHPLDFVPEARLALALALVLFVDGPVLLLRLLHRGLRVGEVVLPLRPRGRRRRPVGLPR